MGDDRLMDMPTWYGVTLIDAKGRSWQRLWPRLGPSTIRAPVVTEQGLVAIDFHKTQELDDAGFVIYREARRWTVGGPPQHVG